MWEPLPRSANTKSEMIHGAQPGTNENKEATKGLTSRASLRSPEQGAVKGQVSVLRGGRVIDEGCQLFG
jgi:hypothetical protein